jgi:hypothetical protein
MDLNLDLFPAIHLVGSELWRFGDLEIHPLQRIAPDLALTQGHQAAFGQYS